MPLNAASIAIARSARMEMVDPRRSMLGTDAGESDLSVKFSARSASSWSVDDASCDVSCTKARSALPSERGLIWSVANVPPRYGWPWPEHWDQSRRRA